MAGKKLLVADDSLTIQKVIRLALSNEGYEIQAISDGNEAIQHISVFRPDVVLIDVSLPGRSAFEVKEEANQLEDFSGVRFVLMSSAFEKIDESEAARVNFHGRLTKPFDPANLRQVLAEVIGMSAPAPVKMREPEPIITGKLSLAPDAPPLPFPSTPGMPPRPILEPYPGHPTPEDELMEPIRPDLNEPSILVSQSVSGADAIKSLWDDPPAPPTEPPTVEENDIKHLTESTIRMSGLDDFQWNVKEPSLKPFPNLSDDGGVGMSVPPPPLYSQEEPKGHSSEKTAPSLTPPPRPGVEPKAHFDEPKGHFDEPKTHFNEPAAHFDDEAIRKQVQETLEKMVQQILPDLAEKVIKQEIHRLLSERV